MKNILKTALWVACFCSIIFAISWWFGLDFERLLLCSLTAAVGENRVRILAMEGKP